MGFPMGADCVYCEIDLPMHAVPRIARHIEFASTFARGSQFLRGGSSSNQRCACEDLERRTNPCGSIHQMRVLDKAGLAHSAVLLNKRSTSSIDHTPLMYRSSSRLPSPWQRSTASATDIEQSTRPNTPIVNNKKKRKTNKQKEIKGKTKNTLNERKTI